MIPVPQTQDFLEENNLEMPIKELTDFDTFEIKLKDIVFRQKFVIYKKR